MANVSVSSLHICAVEQEEEAVEGNLGVFIIVALVLGVLTSIAKRNFHWLTLPFTLVLFLLGNLVGGVHEAVSLGHLSESLDLWQSLNPETLLFLFLPPLLFVSAFEVEYHIFRRLIWQSVLLATVGVAINSGLLALVSIGFFGYGWGADEGLLFGAMFGATDPVAVVALLHELGAPETLTVLIEGESLLNDGVGFVLFQVFFEQLSGAASLSYGEIMWRVLLSSSLGIVVGIVTGLVGLLAMQQVWEDSTLATAISVIAVWGTFEMAEVVHGSGVIAVVCVGLVFAAYADGYIKVEVKKSLVRFWKKIEYITNIVLFALSGVTVVTVLVSGQSQSGEESGYRTTWRDLLNLGVLFVAINFVRLVSVVVLMPWLQRSGYGLSWRRAWVVSYSGLRGAVGLIAALIVVDECPCADDDHQLSPDALVAVGAGAGADAEGLNTVCLVFETQSRMIFHMSGIVLLTLLVNGTTAKHLVNFLGLNKQTETAHNFFEKATVHVHEHMDFVVESLKRHPYYKSADWDVVWRHVPILSRQVYQERRKMGLEHNRDTFRLLREIDRIAKSRFAADKKCQSLVTSPSGAAFARNPSADGAPHAQDKGGGGGGGGGGAVLRKLGSRGSRRSQGSGSGSGSVSGSGSGSGSGSDGEQAKADDPELQAYLFDQQLREARYRFLNLVKASYRHQFDEGANQSWPSMQVLIEAASRCQDHPGRPVAEWQESVAAYVGVPRLWWRVKSCGLKTMASHLEYSYNVATTFVRAHKSVITPFKHFVNETTEEIVHTILTENAAMLREATAFTEHVERDFPEVAASVKTNVAIQRLLREMENYAHKMLERAEIDERDLETIEHALERSRVELKHLKGKVTQTPEQILKNCTIFLDVALEFVDIFLGISAQRTLQCGEVLFSDGSEQLRASVHWPDDPDDPDDPDPDADIDPDSDHDGVGVGGDSQESSAHSLHSLHKSAHKSAHRSAHQSAHKSPHLPTHLFLIVKGKVLLTFPSGVEIEKSAGDVVGVVEFITGKPFARRAVCVSSVEVVAISHALARDVGARSTELHDNMNREAGLAVLESYYPQFQFASFNLLKSVLPHVRVVYGSQRTVASSQSRHRPSVVGMRKPVFFHGGIVIGIRGETLLTDSGNSMPMRTVVHPHSALILSEDAVIMHISAEAVANLDEYISFDPSFASRPLPDANRGMQGRQRARTRHRRRNRDKADGHGRHGEHGHRHGRHHGHHKHGHGHRHGHGHHHHGRGSQASAVVRAGVPRARGASFESAITISDDDMADEDFIVNVAPGHARAIASNPHGSAMSLNVSATVESASLSSGSDSADSDSGGDSESGGDSDGNDSESESSVFSFKSHSPNRGPF